MAVSFNKGLDSIGTVQHLPNLTHSHSKVIKSKSSHRSIHPTVPSLKKNKTHLSVKSKKPEDLLLTELNNVLKDQSTEIEKKIDAMEHRMTGVSATDTMINVKSWALSQAEISKQAAESGVAFLQKILPEEILEQEEISKGFEVFKDITKAAGLLFKCLDLGSKTAAVICKDRLLKQSRQLLKQAQNNLDDQKNLRQLDSRENLRKMLLEWEVKLNEEEKILNKEKMGAGMHGIGMFLGISSLVIQELSQTYSYLKPVGMTFSWTLTGLAFIGKIFGLKSSIKDLNLLKEWSQSFQQWHKHHHHIVDQSVDLLAKRKEVAIKKRKQLASDFKAIGPKIPEMKRKQFDGKEDFIIYYVDHQETIELTIKNALLEMISKKHTVEEGVLKFKMASNAVQFSFDTFSLMVTAALAIAGILTIPVSGVGFILIGLSVGSSIVSGTLAIEKIRRAYGLKPATFMACFSDGILTSIMFAKLQSSIRNFCNRSKKQKLIKYAEVLQTLHISSISKEDPKYLKAYANYKQAKMNFEDSLKNAKIWTERLRDLENTLKQKGWEDFVQQASLQLQKDPNAFDTLRALSDALQHADFNLLSNETKTLLEKHLGMDLKALQILIEKDPMAIERALQNFFVLDDSKLLVFINTQQARMNAGLIQTTEIS